MHRYVIKWSDGYPTTFYTTIEKAREALSEAEDRGITGEIMTYEEYMKEEVN